ncbi:MAG: ATPase [Deltaproteobacteria bacterium HGW-Deltaproteobacteria-10]|nr:MAG: ATPase [Deltaproteobacteria bacterium HGW-Deltaproteobacteria-10]
MVRTDKVMEINQVEEGLKSAMYICSRQIATTVYLAHNLEKPILVEGPAGVGKTELAKVTAEYLNLPLIRIQCYEGLDESKALYEWKYGKQLLYTQLLKDKLDNILNRKDNLADSISKLHQYDDIFFSSAFLEPRPLLKALQQADGAVLLIDEIDKADEEFEAFLLEVLSDFQVSIPEIGTVKAINKPFVFLTSNSTRELSEALKRRCLHLYIPFPDAALEKEIIKTRVPGIGDMLRTQLVDFIQAVRRLDIKKVPSISETIDWAKVLLLLQTDSLTNELVKDTLNVILKHQEDISIVEEKINEFISVSPRAAR